MQLVDISLLAKTGRFGEPEGMSEWDPSDHKNDSKPKSNGGLLWFLSVLMIGGGVIFTMLGGWLAAAIGLILLVYASVLLASEWADSAAAALGIWLLLVLGGLALAGGAVLAACSSIHI